MPRYTTENCHRCGVRHPADFLGPSHCTYVKKCTCGYFHLPLHLTDHEREEAIGIIYIRYDGDIDGDIRFTPGCIGVLY